MRVMRCSFGLMFVDVNAVPVGLVTGNGIRVRAVHSCCCLSTKLCWAPY